VSRRTLHTWIPKSDEDLIFSKPQIKIAAEQARRYLGRYPITPSIQYDLQAQKYLATGGKSPYSLAPDGNYRPIFTLGGEAAKRLEVVQNHHNAVIPSAIYFSRLHLKCSQI
jgi:hypothetical protein